MNFMGLLDFLPKSFPKTLGPFISKGGTGGRASLQTYSILASVTLALLETISVTEIQMSSPSIRQSVFH